MYKSEEGFKRYVNKKYPGWDNTSEVFRVNIAEAFAAGCHFIMSEIEKSQKIRKEGGRQAEPDSIGYILKGVI